MPRKKKKIRERHGRGLFLILEAPYPNKPGIMVQRIDKAHMGVYSISETMRKYKRLATLDAGLFVVEGSADIQKIVLDNYHRVSALKNLTLHDYNKAGHCHCH